MINYDNQHLSLLKSAVVETMKTTKSDKAAKERILKGLDMYCDAVVQNKTIEKPKENFNEASDPWITAYLLYLHHKKAHAKIAANSKLEKEIEIQLKSFTFGDEAWQQMFDTYVKYYWLYPHHTGGKPHYRSWQDTEYGNNDYNYGVIEWKLPSDATVAIIGDIGTGTDVAAAVLIGILQFNPDVILHVGDVYYSGTKHEFENYFIGLLQDVFKDQGKKVPVYTLPGNHEYFSGGIAYYECLDSNFLVKTEKQRQKASFFKLVTEDEGWQFLGMDTAYHGHYLGVKGEKLTKALKALHTNSNEAWNPVTPPKMVYVRPDEVQWHHYHLESYKGKTILLGHHQLYSANQTVGIPQAKEGSTFDKNDLNRRGINTKLWKSFGKYFDKIAAWFWGHEHNLVIFQDNYRPKEWPDSDEKNFEYKTLKKGRCIGHSAIPVAEKEQPYKQNNPIPLVNENLKLSLKDGWYNRGFEIIKFNGKGKPAIASYYEVNGVDPKPIKLYEEELN